MVRKILFALFWGSALLIVAFAFRAGGSALLIPSAVALALVVFGADLYRNRRLVAFDRDLFQTALHLSSAVALASGTLYWGLRLFGPK